MYAANIGAKNCVKAILRGYKEKKIKFFEETLVEGKKDVLYLAARKGHVEFVSEFISVLKEEGTKSIKNEYYKKVSITYELLHKKVSSYDLEIRNKQQKITLKKRRVSLVKDGVEDPDNRKTIEELEDELKSYKTDINKIKPCKKAIYDYLPVTSLPIQYHCIVQ